MDQRRISRRAIVRTSLAASAGGALGGRPPHPAAAGRRQSATPVAGALATSPPIALDLRGGDAWAWRKRLTGTCPGCLADATISLRVGDSSFPAERTGDAFAATVRLRPGPNPVVAVLTHPDGREEVSASVVHTLRLVPRPTARLHLTVAGDTVVLDGGASTPSEFDGAPILGYHWQERADNPAPLSVGGDSPQASPVAAEAQDVPRPTAFVPVPAVDGEYTVSLSVVDAAGREDVAAATFVVAHGTARVPDPVRDSAAWIQRAVVYGVVTWAFGDEGFRSVTARLDELRDLGVDALWFAPITQTLPGLFGYEVTDYFAVRPEFGTIEDFRELVLQAHSRGIRVLIDFVPNHTSIEHPYFQDAEAHGPASPTYDFYDRDEGGNYTYYFDWLHLPNLNFANPEVRRFMLEAFTFWLRDLDVDGFRVDAVWGIKERQPTYLADVLDEMNRIKPDSLLIAEASARDPFYAEQGFDAAYDWTDELGYWAWADVFADIGPIGRGMRSALTADGAGYHPDAVVFRFLNNNDTGDRFVSVYGVDFYRVALAMLLTLAGIPCLYTGDEVGAEFLPYGTTMPIDWADRFGLRDHVKKLIALRRDQPSLHARGWLPLDAEPASPLFAYLRSGAPTDAPVLVVLNFSGDPVEATLSLPPAAHGFGQGGTLSDLMAGETIGVAAADTPTIPVPAWGVRILVDGKA